jgi:hypothetical protein
MRRATLARRLDGAPIPEGAGLFFIEEEPDSAKKTSAKKDSNPEGGKRRSGDRRMAIALPGLQRGV